MSLLRLVCANGLCKANFFTTTTQTTATFLASAKKFSILYFGENVFNNFNQTLVNAKYHHYQIVRYLATTKESKKSSLKTTSSSSSSSSLLSSTSKNNDTFNSSSSSSSSSSDERIFETLSVEKYAILYEKKLPINTKTKNKSNLKSKSDSSSSTKSPTTTTNIDTTIRDKIVQILQQYEHEKYLTTQVSSTITVDDMRDLLAVYDDERELTRALKFLYIRECNKYNSKKRKRLLKLEIAERKRQKYGAKNEDQHDDNDNEDNDSKTLSNSNPTWEHGIFSQSGELTYGLWHNSLLARITKQSVRDYRQRHLLRQAAIFGQKLIIDLDYDSYMKLYEARLLASQLGLLYYENRVNHDFPQSLPFDIHFTNCSKAPNTMEALKKHIKRMDQLVDYFHLDSYLSLPKLFPRNRLVYLSPHATRSLHHYSHDDIFILGGYNDRTTHMRVSNVKAEAEGIRCFRLPLDENVLWRQGNKNLCVNQVAAILHCVKSIGDWRTAIQRYAPQRKMKSVEEVAIEDQIRIKQMSQRMKRIQRSYALNKNNFE